MKTSCAGAIRGLWDELNQGLFPGIDDSKSSDALLLRCSDAEVGQDRASGVD